MPAAAFAGDGQQTPQPVALGDGATDTIFVRAPLIADSPFRAGPAVVTVIPLQDRLGGADLAELLDRAAGLQIRRYGGLGAEAVPSLRGSTGSQVVVMVDGLPLADAQDGVIDLAALPLERFASAEIYRGLVPAQHGGIGGVGAINLISRATGPGDADLRLFVGSFGDAGGRLARSFRSADGQRTALVMLHGRRIDNRFGFTDHRQTLHDSSDDVSRQLQNGDFAEWGGYWNGLWEGRSLSVGLSTGYYRRDGGRPGPLLRESPHAALRRRTGDARLFLRGRDGNFQLDLKASQAEELLHDESREVLVSPGTQRGLSSNLSGRLMLSRAIFLDGLGIGGAARGQIGAEWKRQWHDEAFNGNAEPLRVRNTAGVTASLQLDLPGPRLALTPAWRWQRSSDNFPPVPALPGLPEQPLAEPRVMTAAAPSLGLWWEIAPGRLFGEAHAARSRRMPSWVELFGYGHVIVGNRQLRPEDVTTYDVAVRWRAGGGGRHARLAFFWMHTDDAIIFRQNSLQKSIPLNIGATRSRGLELEAGGRLPGGGSWTSNLTWQRARDAGLDPTYHGREIPFLPALEALLHLERFVGPWRPGVTLIHESANYRDRYNWAVNRAPARTLLNLSVARTFGPAPAQRGSALTVTAEVLNITDDDVYDVQGFPLPGRSARLSVHLH